MDFENQSPMQAGWTMGFDRDGREMIIVVAKATYDLSAPEENLRFAEEQVPLVESDTFTGEPGLSAPVFESDFAHHKPRCDVLVLGRAHAPDGKSIRRVDVELSVGPIHKHFIVTGKRIWRPGSFGPVVSEPEPFLSTSVTYDRAFGGVDDPYSSDSKRMTYVENPVGLGYRPYLHEINDTEVARTEERHDPIHSPQGKYRPMSLGPLGRNWQPRVSYAGTYTETWIKQRSPFWPSDFDYRYFQSAPTDQQMDYPQGGETVSLLNMSANGAVEFSIPRVEIPIVMVPYRGPDIYLKGVLDTIVIEPESHRVTTTWRTRHVMKKSCFDIRQTVVGVSADQWRRKRRDGTKRRYANLNEMISEKRNKNEPGS